MPWYTYLVHFLGGAFLANSIPHYVHGISGEKFQSPFAKPPGVGLSSPRTNVLWGFANFVVGIVLLLLWAPDSRDLLTMGAVAAGVLLMGLMLSGHFGKVKGNN